MRDRKDQFHPSVLPDSPYHFWVLHSTSSAVVVDRHSFVDSFRYLLPCLSDLLGVSDQRNAEISRENSSEEVQQAELSHRQ